MEAEVTVPMKTNYCRLAIIFARQATKAVIFRRGPTDWVQIILWHTDTDTFEEGQWFRGRIYHKRADLSPDGSKLIYLAAKHHRWRTIDPEYSTAWTAISKPPYLTALALWRNIDTHGGGGYFEDNNTVWINLPYLGDLRAMAHRNHLPPADLNIKSREGYVKSENSLSELSLQRNGWMMIQEKEQHYYNVSHIYEPPGIWEKTNGDYTISMKIVGFDLNKRHRNRELHEFRLLDKVSSSEIGIETDTLANWDQQNRLVYVKAGQLLAGEIHNGKIEARVIADFNANKPKLITSPEWAKKWD